MYAQYRKRVQVRTGWDESDKANVWPGSAVVVPLYEAAQFLGMEDVHRNEEGMEKGKTSICFNQALLR